MSILNFLGISDAVAATTTTAANGAGSIVSFLPMMFIFILGAYFLMIRPQSRRAKAHRKLLSELAKGDEIVTVGGVVGKISKINDDFITMSVADNVDITIQKAAIANVLPKGTIKTINS